MINSNNLLKNDAIENFKKKFIFYLKQNEQKYLNICSAKMINIFDTLDEIDIKQNLNITMLDSIDFFYKDDSTLIMLRFLKNNTKLIKDKSIHTFIIDAIKHYLLPCTLLREMLDFFNKNGQIFSEYSENTLHYSDNVKEFTCRFAEIYLDELEKNKDFSLDPNQINTTRKQQIRKTISQACIKKESTNINLTTFNNKDEIENAFSKYKSIFNEKYLKCENMINYMRLHIPANLKTTPDKAFPENFFFNMMKLIVISMHNSNWSFRQSQEKAVQEKFKLDQIEKNKQEKQPEGQLALQEKQPDLSSKTPEQIAKEAYIIKQKRLKQEQEEQIREQKRIEIAKQIEIERLKKEEEDRKKQENKEKQEEYNNPAAVAARKKAKAEEQKRENLEKRIAAKKQAKALAEKQLAEKIAKELAEKTAKELAEKQAKALAEEKTKALAEKQAKELAEEKTKELAAKALAEKQAKELAEKQALENKKTNDHLEKLAEEGNALIEKMLQNQKNKNLNKTSEASKDTFKKQIGSNNTVGENILKKQTESSKKSNQSSSIKLNPKSAAFHYEQDNSEPNKNSAFDCSNSILKVLAKSYTESCIESQYYDSDNESEMSELPCPDTKFDTKFQYYDSSNESEIYNHDNKENFLTEEKQIRIAILNSLENDKMPYTKDVKKDVEFCGNETFEMCENTF